ncbi:hypothetical protein [Streptomyces solaniscabiei]|uniref:hypothetical protein n=1 Tax=Streptomyces solaniscabiei TaxID=2683255 RepID=UPI003558DBE9
MLWRLRTRISWRSCRSARAPGRPPTKRFIRWNANGTWARLRDKGQAPEPRPRCGDPSRPPPPTSRRPDSRRRRHAHHALTDVKLQKWITARRGRLPTQAPNL